VAETAETPDRNNSGRRHTGLVVWTCALVGFLSVAFTKDDPGFTSDEPFNALYAKTIVAGLLQDPSLIFERKKVDLLFGSAAEHPPLGRYFIGLVSYCFDANFWNVNIFDLRAARWAAALLFAMLVGLVARWTVRRSNWFGGIAAAVLCLTLPRLFGHGHFSALEMPLCVAYATAAFALGRWARTGSLPAAALAGVAVGLALLTKMQGVFLVPVIGLVAVLGGKRYWAGALIALVAAAGTFFVGWPWLWYAPADRAMAYFGRGVARSPTLVTYFGTVYEDKAVPWTYPFVMAVVTLPAGHLLLVAWRLVETLRHLSRRDELTVLAAALVPLAAFSLPGVPVYDGVRLFLMSFPLLLTLAGASLGRWYARFPRTAPAVLLLSGAIGLAGIYRTHPCELSYYGEWIGGLRGASRLGMQLTYWGDSVTPDLLRRWSEAAGRRAAVRLVPTLYVSHPELYLTEEMARRGQRVVAQDESAEYTLVFRRTEYVPVEVLREADAAVPVAEVVREGVWLTRVYRNRNGARSSEDER